jgi:hypothetical protein
MTMGYNPTGPEFGPSVSCARLTSVRQCSVTRGRFAWVNAVTDSLDNIYDITTFYVKSCRSRQTATSHDKPRPNDDIGDFNDKAGW